MPKTSLRMFTRFISGVFSIHGQESYQWTTLVNVDTDILFLNKYRIIQLLYFILVYIENKGTLWSWSHGRFTTVYAINAHSEVYST